MFKTKPWMLTFFILLITGFLLPSHGVKNELQKVSKVPKIISLGGSITEILYNLGVYQHIIGRDITSYYPQKVLAIPSVGYRHNLNSEGILSLQPELIIGDKGIRPPQVIEQLQDANVDLLLLKEAASCQDAITNIQQVGAALNREAEAQQQIQTIQMDLEKLQAKLAKQSEQTKVKALLLYVRGNQSQFILGEGASVSEMLKIAGAENIAVGVKGAKPITSEAMVALQPEVLVLFQKGVESIGGVESVFKLPGVAFTPAGKNRRIVIMDDLYLGGFGPRCGKAALDLFHGLYETSGVYISEG